MQSWIKTENKNLIQSIILKFIWMENLIKKWLNVFNLKVRTRPSYQACFTKSATLDHYEII